MLGGRVLGVQASMTWKKALTHVDHTGFRFPYYEQHRRPVYYVFFWEFVPDDDPDPDDPDWEFWMETFHILSDVDDVLEAIEWEKAHANGRVSATCVGYYQPIAEHPEKEVQNLVRVHGTIPEGRLVSKESCFDWYSFPDFWPRGKKITTEEIAEVDKQLADISQVDDVASLLDRRFSASIEAIDNWFDELTVPSFCRMLSTCYFGVLRDYVHVLTGSGGRAQGGEVETLFVSLILEDLEAITVTTAAVLNAWENFSGELWPTYSLALILAYEFVDEELQVRISKFLQEHPLPPDVQKGFEHRFDTDPTIYFELLLADRKKRLAAEYNPEISIISYLVPWNMLMVSIMRWKKNLPLVERAEPEFQQYLGILQELKPTDLEQVVTTEQHELKAAVMQRYKET